MILINDLDLEKLAEDKKLTKNEIVEATGISRKTLWTYFSHKHEHHLPKRGIVTDRLYDILKLFGMELVVMEKSEYEAFSHNAKRVAEDLKKLDDIVSKMRKEYLDENI